MSIEAIQAVAASVSAPTALPAQRMDGADFSGWLAQGLSNVDASLKTADEGLRALAAGEASSPHEVMIAMEQARMNLMLMVEVRNRVVEAYQELARMQL